MPRRWRTRIEAMMMATALSLTGCGVAPQAKPASPASSVDSQSPVPVGKEPSPEPRPTAPQPRVTPVSSDLVGRLDAAGWQFDAVAPLLPSSEGQYQPTGEEPNFIEYAYASGALRLYVSPEGGRVFALLVDVSNPAYAGFGAITTSAHYTVIAASPYIVIARSAPIDEATFATLRSRSWSLADLRSQLGEPSHRQHLHGLGGPLYTYIPQGLAFFPDGQDLFHLIDPNHFPGLDHTRPVPTFDEYRRDFAGRLSDVGRVLVSTLTAAKTAMAQGKPSPDGRYRAANVHRGGYWADWLYIQRPGSAEVRVNPTYFIQGYEWLDDHRLVYVTGLALRDGYPVTVIDAATGRQQAAAVLPCPAGMVLRGFGVIGPGQLWYQLDDGVRREVPVR